MSRIGNKIIIVPEGVQVTLEGLKVGVKGPKGALTKEVPSLLDIRLSQNQLSLQPKDKEGMTKQTHALWGTWRQLIANMITGVKDGYEKKLEIEGVGYRAALQGQELVIEIGFTNPVKFQIPQGLTVLVEKNVVSIAGIEKDVVGQFAATVRKTRKAEPYKGKGIKYVGEQIRRKLGKRAAAAAGPAK